jgi:hypothetical protein
MYSTHAASASGWTRTGKQTADKIGGTFPTEQLKDAILWVNYNISIYFHQAENKAI